MSYLSVLRTALNDKLQQLEDVLAEDPTHSLPHLLEARPYQPFDDPDTLPSQDIFELVEKVRVDLNALDALITPTRFKLVELATAHYKVAALNVAVLTNVSGEIESFGGEANLGQLAQKVGVNEHKLGMTCAVGIPKDIISPETKDSFADTQAPFTKMVSKEGQTFAEYMGDPENAAMVTLGSEGIVGWLNKLTRVSLLEDYPWQELGKVKVIDIGAGTGDSGMDIMRKYPELTWVYQDLGPVIDTLHKNYPDDLRHRVDDGNISFVVQDYFEPNVSDGNIWYLRGVL
ncbi:hypothetical protein N0V90_010020 [Kalmusia sp. IMI 367209]|nr:hypothetical protein N0V90_010020 [Kalmusia sp. IMI 367209]